MRPGSRLKTVYVWRSEAGRAGRGDTITKKRSAGMRYSVAAGKGEKWREQPQPHTSAVGVRGRLSTPRTLSTPHLITEGRFQIVMRFHLYTTLPIDFSITRCDIARLIYEN